MSFNPGDRVGDYEIVAALGAGGMGKVYKVRNLLSDRIEAMKVLLPDLEGNAELANRFLREIKVQASLTHPNIAALHTALTYGNQLLMLMEFVEGASIESMLEKGPLPLDQALDYTIQVLSALSYAHGRGVIHRDIKPANIMVTPDGVVKLMDFGIARMRADQRLTQTGLTVGSLYYMSPEQIRADRELDARSDLYSLGVTLYEIVTGKRPFTGTSDFAIMAAHLQQNPVPPIQIDPKLPALLNEIIMMAIAKQPEQRFQSAEAFRTALLNVKSALIQAPREQQQMAAAQAAAASPSPSPARKSHRGLYMALGSLATLAVLVLAALQIPKWRGAQAGAQADNPAAQESAVQPSAPSPSAPAVPESQPQAAAEQPPPAGTQPFARKDESPSPHPQAPAPKPPAEPAAQIPRTPVTPLARAPNTQPAPQQRHSTPAVARSQSDAVQQRAVQPATQQPAAQQAAPQQPAAQPPAVQQAAPQQPAAQPPAASRTSAAELETLRERMMKLAARFGAVQAKARRIEQEQRAQGLGMRSDVVSGISRATFYMDEAEAALRSNNAAAMKTALERAGREVDKLEDILGI